MTFVPRTTSPSMSNKYFIHTSYGGYNKCIRISGNQCLPNCVGYAYGRFMEAGGVKSCKLPLCNAEDWISQARKNGFATGTTPKVGAVMCFRKGRVAYGGDGAGHVLIVEKVYSDGSILCSQSGYRSARFWTTKFTKPYRLNGYAFQGFIYNPFVNTTAKAYTGTFPTLPSRGYFKKGDKGTQVKNLQKFLNWYGGYGLVVDGKLGNNTIAAVKKFQKATGLSQDGLFGAKSLAKAKAVKR